ncbi:MAG: hypothetical protein OS130_01165 [Thermodesulfobacteriota bacterium]|jgi:hypothetical protein|nr:MAG: hypothetical protein OS130_01165 [Thermodesulfobacteriota bacterium]
MNRIFIGLGVIIFTLAFLAIPHSNAQPYYGGWYCPRMQQEPGVQQGGWGCPPLRPGQGAPQGRWGCYQGGWAYCPYCGSKLGAPHDTSQKHPTKLLTQDEAKTLLEKSLQLIKNPNLKVGDISDKGATYEVNILTKEGSLVDKVQIDKNTGWFKSIY